MVLLLYFGSKSIAFAIKLSAPRTATFNLHVVTTYYRSGILCKLKSFTTHFRTDRE